MPKPIDEHHHIRLSDLLLDAEVELKSIDMKSLAGAVRVARDRIVGTPHDEQVVGHVPDVAMWPTLNTTPGEPILKPVTDDDKKSAGEEFVTCPACATRLIVGRFAQAIYESRRRRIQSGKPIGEGESQAFEALDFEDTHENVRELYRLVARESLQSIVEHFPRTFATLATELGLAVPERDARDA